MAIDSVNGTVEPYVRTGTDQIPSDLHAAKQATIALHDELHTATAPSVIGRQRVVNDTNYVGANVTGGHTVTNDAGKITNSSRFSIPQARYVHPTDRAWIQHEHEVRTEVTRSDGSVRVDATVDSSASDKRVVVVSHTEYEADGSARADRIAVDGENRISAHVVASRNGTLRFTNHAVGTIHVDAPGSLPRVDTVTIDAKGERNGVTGHMYEHMVEREPSGKVDVDIYGAVECKLGSSSRKLQCTESEVGNDHGRLIHIDWTHDTRDGNPLVSLSPIDPRPKSIQPITIAPRSDAK
jgi:hypothetical protein